MHTLGKLTEVITNENRVTLNCKWNQHPAVHFGNQNYFGGRLSFRNVLPGVVHVELLRDVPWKKEEAALSYTINESTLQSLPIEVEEDENTVIIKTDEIDIVVEKEPVAVTFYDKKGNSILKEKTPGIEWEEWGYKLNFATEDSERFYGLGQTDQDVDQVPFNLKGNHYLVHHQHMPAPSRMIFPVIFSSKNYAVIIDNPYSGEIDLDSHHENRWFYQSKGGPISYFIIKGENVYQIIKRYVELTGKPALPPKWVFGFMQSKYGYKTQEEVESLVETFHNKKIPIDTVILDLYWFKYMGDLAFDKENFPAPKELISRLKDQGIKVILIEEPYVTVKSQSFKEGKEKGYFATNPKGDVYTIPFWAGESALIDFTNPEAKKWWAEKHQPLIEMGVGGWWTDLNEPKVHPDDMVHHDGSASKVHNIIALEMHKTLMESYKKYAPNERLFIMSRSGWMGMQKYGAGTWSGDVASNWEALRNQISVGVNMGLLGVPIWNTDIGGFLGDYPSAELYIRWMQFGTFTPMMRPHGDHQEREPWGYGPKVEEIIQRYIQLRYQLVPYLYTYAYESHLTGAPLMRPLLLEYSSDSNVFNMTDEFLLGRDILVAPVMEEGSTGREVYLPNGEWVDFWTDEVYQGNQKLTVDAPLDIIPLFIKKGSIIPMATNPVNTTQQAEEPLDIHFYIDRSGEFKLYDDDGISMDYLNAKPSFTTFNYLKNEKELSITFENNMKQDLNVKLHLIKNAKSVILNKEKQLDFNYSNKSLNFSIKNLSNGSIDVI
jgi:alpha-glucosidase (family GH31 glycosyl hydrolase)